MFLWGPSLVLFWTTFSGYQAWRNITAFQDFPISTSTIFTKPKTNDSVSLRWLVAGFPPRLPRFDPRLSHVGFVVDKVALGQVFSENVGFPCQFSFHQMFHTHLSTGAGAIGQLVANVPSGLSLTPPHKTKKIEYILIIIYLRAQRSYSEYMMIYDGEYETCRWHVNGRERNELLANLNG
jgi:hypothetical protein